MNRRNFIGGLLAAEAGFTILPGAGRVWKVVKEPPLGIDWRPNPAWVDAEYEMVFFGKDGLCYEFSEVCEGHGKYEMYHTGVRYVNENGVFKRVEQFVEV